MSTTFGQGERVDLVAVVAQARRGEHSAWATLVGRFQPLVCGIARGHRLGERDVEDVAQNVWLRVVEHLGRLREPRALPGWIVTTTRHESLRVLRERNRALPVDVLAETGADPAEPALDEPLLRAEEARALRAGLAELPAAQRHLLLLLAAEPPLTYREISARLDMPMGSIGPTRARSLDKLRRTSAVSGYVDAGRRTA